MLGVKRGGLTDKHIRLRRQRLVPMAASLVSVIAGTVLLYVLHAAKAIAALVVAMLIGLVSAHAVTVRWQISIHNAVAVGWSRLVLQAHTMTQVIAGTGLGGISRPGVHPAASTPRR